MVTVFIVLVDVLWYSLFPDQNWTREFLATAIKLSL